MADKLVNKKDIKKIIVGYLIISIPFGIVLGLVYGSETIRSVIIGLLAATVLILASAYVTWMAYMFGSIVLDGGKE